MRAELGVAADVRRVDALLTELGGDHVAERVGPDAADHRDVRAGPRRGDRLIAALAAHERMKARTEDGLAARR
jgi:hypothetical protein